MNMEIRSVRLKGCTVALTMHNATEQSMEKLLTRAKYYSDSGFKTEETVKEAFKRLKITFEEPTAAKQMMEYVTGMMYGSTAS